MTTLREFVTKALLARRIGFGDLRRLQRVILPHGITTREEAEVLIALDGSIQRVDRAWTEALIIDVTKYAVGSGHVDADTSAWLVEVLASARLKTATAIARQVVQEADEIDDVLLAFSGTKRVVVPDHSPRSDTCPETGPRELACCDT